MPDLVERTSYFLIPVLLALIAGLFLVLSYDKIELHLQLTSRHHPTTDVFFKYYTEVGHGITCMVIIILLALTGCQQFWPVFLFGSTAYALTGLFAQFLKRIVFDDFVRPRNLIAETDLHIIEGVQLHGFHSFPSGHATTTFVLFTFLAIIYQRKKLVQVGFALLALVGAYSRVYLSQHFLQDVLAGATIGLVGMLGVYWVFSTYTFQSYFKSGR